MRVLMLGWEFPPFISGGLGTACYGLTRALDRLGHEVLFVLPRSVDRTFASHVKLLSPEAGAADAVTGPLALPPPADEAALQYTMQGFSHAKFWSVPSSLVSPYKSGSPTGQVDAGEAGFPSAAMSEIDALRAAGVDVSQDLAGLHGGSFRRAADYSGDMIGSAQQYARLVVRLCRGQKFDVVHCHDWMTYPAGMAVAQASGKPLVAHIHSTEFDRSGEHVHQAVYDIERRGMHAALRVVAVSAYTRNVCIQRYSIDPAKIDVVYNGIESAAESEVGEGVGSKDKIVLFLGRITMQKGPEYFVHAAKRVLSKMDNVKFIVAGSGDMYRRMIHLAAELGIGHKVLFTGFLRGKDVTRVFQMADCYVMPSVSEPFGIAPLEAISLDTPVIISKQSGVSEVLTHALKVDFWDVDEMANKIIAVLRHPPLSQTLREHGAFEIRKLTWDGAAQKCVKSYSMAIEQMSGRPAARPLGV
jgi:glycosyltransferase involved in cell wall biosynthesis